MYYMIKSNIKETHSEKIYKIYIELLKKEKIWKEYNMGYMTIKTLQNLGHLPKY